MIPSIEVKRPDPRPGYHVGSHENGLAISAAVGAGASAYNLVPNPRFHLSAVDAWYFSSYVFDVTRVTEPPVALPPGADACAKLHWKVLNQTSWLSDRMPWPAGKHECYVASMFYTPTVMQTVPGGDPSWIGVPHAVFYDMEGNYGAGARTASGWVPGYDPTMSEFLLAWSITAVPSYLDDGRALDVRAGFQARMYAGQDVYQTLAIASPEQMAYADGDTDGWWWAGAPHNSVSLNGGSRVETFNVERDELGLFIGVAPKPVISGGGGD